ncbi:MAG TPA: DUF4238 domain-containing protein [Bryobacteraceae bacterium]|nr:DUF4238 domain-containing protein [Bryobacteraceae bacterium]
MAETYQKGFADVDEKLWLYDRHLQQYRKVHPKHICVENDLYTIDPEDTRNSFIESEWLSKLDGEAATAIRLFQKRFPFDREWRESFSIFIAQQITRSPSFRDMTIANFRAMGEEILRLGFSDVERASELLERYHKHTGKTLPEKITAQSLVEAKDEVYVTVTERPFLEYMMKGVAFLARWIERFNWEVLVSPRNTGFIICDYPFTVVPPRSNPGAIGIAAIGATKYFPLTRQLCLRMTAPEFQFSYQTASKQEIRTINQNVAVNSERFIMGPNRKQVEFIIARSGTTRPDPIPRTTTDVIHRDDDNGLIRFSMWPRRRYFYLSG